MVLSIEIIISYMVNYIKRFMYERTTMVTEAILVLIICAFGFIPLILGEAARNKSIMTCSDFVLKRRQLGIPSMFSTVFATWISAFAFTGAIDYFYENGPIYMTTIGWDMLFAVLILIIGRRIWFYGKQHEYMTSIDFFNDIYESKTLNTIVTVINIVSTLLYMQAQVIAAIVLLQSITKNTASSYLIGVLFFVILSIYLWAGGLRAVAYTDIFYMILIIGAMLASGFFLAYKAGGISYLFDTLVEYSPEKVTMSMDKIPLWFSLFVIVPVGAFMGPQIWIRNYSAKSEKNFNIIPVLLGFASIISIGTLLAGSACILLAGSAEEPGSILPVLMDKLASPYFTLFILLGIFAAIYSTANSQVHALASIFTLDIYRKIIDKKAPDAKLVSVAKSAVIVICIISYLITIMLSENFFNLAVFALGGTAQLIVSVVGALFWSRSNSKAAISGILIGEFIRLFLIASSSLDTSTASLIGLGVNALLFILVSFSLEKKSTISIKISHYKREYLSRNDDN